MSRLDLVYHIVSSIEDKNVHAFSSYFTDEGTFRLGNYPLLKGRNSISQQCIAFFGLFKTCKFSILSAQEANSDVVCVEGTIAYVKVDQSTVIVPFCITLRLEEGKVYEFVMYVDNSPLLLPTPPTMQSPWCVA